MHPLLDRKEELRLITEFQTWPLFPFLPVKNTDNRKPGEWPQLGCMTATLDGVKPIIYDFTVDTIPKKQEDVKILATFNSFDELVDAGWRVD